MTDRRALERGYAALLRLYPRPFRELYRDDMELLFREQCRDEPAWRVAARTVLDLALTVPHQHLEARMHSSPNPLVPLLFIAVAAGGLLVAAAGGTDATILAAGLGVSGVAGSLAFVAWRRSAPIRSDATAHTWWGLLLGGLALIAAVVAASKAGVDAWYVGMLAIFTALLLIAAGLVGGTAHAIRRLRHDPA